MVGNNEIAFQGCAG